MLPLHLRSLVGDEPVEVRRTHLSEVFLTAAHAYKVKRPVDLGFVDLRDQARRRAVCEAEVRLNRRLAPDVYLGVETLPDGEPVVKMRRLRDEDSLLSRFERGDLDPATIRAVADRVAAFHARAETSPEIAAYGAFDVIRGNAVENYDQAAGTIGVALHRELHARSREATLHDAELLATRFAQRAAAGRVRDTHGDLRLEHVYIEGGDPSRILVIDCIEFSDRFRYADTAADIAFLAMDLAVRGDRSSARALLDRWIEATGDTDAREVIPFYLSYRSAVRGKVAGMTLTDPAISAERARSQLARARRHWLFACGALTAPGAGPVLVGIGGRPGTGKSTLAAALAQARGLDVIRSDLVRREVTPSTGEPSGLHQGRYTSDARDAVYRATFERAADPLFAGRGVIVDASFVADRWREGLLALGRAWGVPVVLLRCEAPPELVRARIEARRGDASEADVSVYDATAWEPESAPVAPIVRPILTGGTVADALRQALRAIHDASV